MRIGPWSAAWVAVLGYLGARWLVLDAGVPALLVLVLGLVVAVVGIVLTVRDLRRWLAAWRASPSYQRRTG